jgi:hypothetical protein
MTRDEMGGSRKAPRIVITTANVALSLVARVLPKDQPQVALRPVRDHNEAASCEEITGTSCHTRSPHERLLHR